MVGAIARGQKLIVPSGSDVIKAGDTVYFAYKPTSQRALLRALHKTRGSLGTACIVGGGNIGLRLARLLENKGVDTKLIDISEERCEQLADQLQGTLVLHGDGTDKSLLQEEHIDRSSSWERGKWGSTLRNACPKSRSRLWLLTRTRTSSAG